MRLSSLVERAARGEEIAIAQAGKPMAKPVAMPTKPEPPRKWGQNRVGIPSIALDFDDPLPEDVAKDFGL